MWSVKRKKCKKIVLSVKITVDIGNCCDDKFLFAGEFCSLRFIVSLLHCHCQTQRNCSCLKIWCILSIRAVQLYTPFPPFSFNSCFFLGFLVSTLALFPEEHLANSWHRLMSTHAHPCKIYGWYIGMFRIFWKRWGRCDDAPWSWIFLKYSSGTSLAHVVCSPQCLQKQEY